MFAYHVFQLLGNMNLAKFGMEDTLDNTVFGNSH